MQEKSDYVEVFGKELDNCEMKCTSIGFPVSFIDWHSSKNNESLIPEFVTNSTYVLTSHLVLKNLTKQHTGNYTCQVSGNPAEKQVFSLIVQSKYFQILIQFKKFLFSLSFLKANLQGR